jgi:hypothetical protein
MAKANTARSVSLWGWVLPLTWEPNNTHSRAGRFWHQSCADFVIFLKSTRVDKDLLPLLTLPF